MDKIELPWGSFSEGLGLRTAVVIVEIDELSMVIKRSDITRRRGGCRRC